ncbi:rod shape-determining protein RodA [Sutcliffiella rhizosphaerae]|uniref:Peptidoglycan glycosyltransferase RodA n=1 Tax=Sutcliffiella rhizosphaerae TaxID=2880967 RepID=A0ABM8YMP5_9BACI|nr:rod shape-determining protein RodA [Sutcliffiella rhizosphaerae]CAG9621014.1 Peptidoglycan glycosyltransferase RodA [Sutcliffiella rhizosphaerae]
MGSENNKLEYNRIDYTLLFLLFLLFIISLLAVYSASGQYFANDPYYFVKRQIVWYIVGIGIMFAIMFFDYELLENLALPFYSIGLILLFAVEFIGTERNGSQRWINLGGFLLQPSEFMKIFLLLVLSGVIYKWSKEKHELDNKTPLSVVVKIMAYSLPPFGLILLQPDLGTALVVGALMVTMLFISGASWRILSIIAGSATAGLATLVYLHNNYFELFSKVIKPHQLERIYGWLSREEYASSYGFQLTEALKGIGSGQVAGRGFLEGVQSQSGRIPEVQTDFIFALIGEEFGFVGATLVISIYFIMIYRLIIIAISCDNPYGTYLVTGVVGLLAFQIFQNIAMTIGLMPITGLALPFMSYGGSALLTNMMAMGIVMSVKYRTKKFMFK